MSADGVMNVIVAGFPYNDINVIVDILAESAVESGMSCTGMSLNTRDTFGVRPSSYQLRIGDRARGAYIPVGDGDLLLGLEAGCALRAAAETMGSHGTAVINTWQYHPPHLVKYPTVDEMIQKLAQLVARVIPVDGTRLGEEAGDRRIAQGLVDMALFGALCGTGLLPFPAGTVESVIRGRYRFQDDAGEERVLKAFALGIASTTASVAA